MIRTKIFSKRRNRRIEKQRAASRAVPAFPHALRAASSRMGFLSNCYVIACIRRDGSVARVGTYSERWPTFSIEEAPILLGEYGDTTFERAIRKATYAFRKTPWVWEWIGPMPGHGQKRHKERYKMHEARMALYERARAGQVRAPEDVRARAAEFFADHDKRMAEIRRHLGGG